MKRIRILARALSPIVINDARQSANNVSLDHIPGSTLRGAMAAAYLRRGGLPDDDIFQTLFGENPLSFPSLLPVSADDDRPSFMPATAVSCKRHPGFLTEGRHGVLDTLAPIARSRLSGELVPMEIWNCTCGNELKPFSGVWNADHAAPQRSATSQSFNRFTGIDRLTGTVAQSIFYTSRSMDDVAVDDNGVERRQAFAGFTYASDAAITALRETAAGALFVGADRTRGFGEIELEIGEESDPRPLDLAGWDAAFRERLGRDKESGVYFTIKLASPAIIVDRFLRPSSNLEFGIPGAGPVMRVVKGVTLRGWQSCWGLPRSDDTGLAAAGVFLFRYEGNDLAALAERLELLRREGIGVRREEGYGMIEINDQLHIRREAL